MNTATASFPLEATDVPTGSPWARQAGGAALLSPSPAAVRATGARSASRTLRGAGMWRWVRWLGVSLAIMALAGAGGFAVGLVSALVGA